LTQLAGIADLNCMQSLLAVFVNFLFFVPFMLILFKKEQYNQLQKNNLLKK